MAFVQFPKQQYFRVLETDTTTQIGYFNVSEGIEIKHMMLTLLVRGLIASPFTFRVKIYGNNLLETPIFMSNWVTLSVATLVLDADGTQYTQNYFGNIYLDFDGYSLNPNIDYYMAVQTNGYTRNADSFFVGINLDWYSEVNNQVDGPDEAGARIRILGIKSL